MIPWVIDTGQISEAFWKPLSVHDPDRMSQYLGTNLGQKLADPEGFEASWRKQAERVAEENDMTVEKALALLSEDHIMRDPWRWDMPEAVIDRIKGSCSPIADEHMFLTWFTADGTPGDEFIDMAKIDRTGTDLVLLDLSDLDPLLRLMMEARFGAASPSFDEHLKSSESFTEVVVGTDDVWSLLSAVWGGEPRRNSVAYLQIKGQQERASFDVHDLYKRSLFGQTTLGCSWYWPFRWRWEERPFVVVVGDEPEDYCLAFALDRLQDGAAWMPYSYVKGRDDLSKRIRSHLGTHLSSVAYTASRRRPVFLTSVSLTEGQRKWAARKVFAHLLSWGDRITRNEGPVEMLVLDDSHRLFCNEHWDTIRWEPFVGDQQAAFTETPIPREVVSRVSERPVWHVDALIDDTPLPARHALSPLVTVGRGWESGLVRSSRSGTSWFSQSLGFIPGGSPLERTLAQPKLRTPSAREVFEALLSGSGLKCEESSAGRFSQGALEMWGGLDALSADLQSNETMAFLTAFRSRRRSNTDPGVYLSGSRRRYLSYEDVVQATGNDEAVREMIDGYVLKGIVRRGLALWCPRCSFADFYEMEEVGATFRCSRCRTTSPLTKVSWKQPDEPTWYYSLDELVYQAVVNDFHVPILALNKLREKKPAFMFCTELLVTDEVGKVLSEADIWTIIEGRIVIGEAKTTDRLGGTAGEEKKAVAKLVRLARSLTADEVVFATSSPSWRTATVGMIEEGCTDFTLRLLSGLGS